MNIKGVKMTNMNKSNPEDWQVGDRVYCDEDYDYHENEESINAYQIILSYAICQK